MKLHKSQLAYTLCAILLIFLVSCAKKESTKASAEKSVSGTSATSGTSTGSKKAELAQLPVRFRQTGYITQEEPSKDVLGQAGEYQMKVGANITSTKGPQPLWDILKRLANLKGMSVSWASDVDPNVRVDVDISADDNFFDAIDNLLRQVDYFQVVKNNVIIVKYRATKRFQISIPYMTSEYTTNVGGDFIPTGGSSKAGMNTAGTVKVNSPKNKFDFWTHITANLDTIMRQGRTTTTEKKEIEKETKGNATAGATGKANTAVSVNLATRRVALGGSYYTIDKSVGMIMVTASRPLLRKVAFYLQSLKKKLYRQVIIEAKIIEVSLTNNSRLGLDWSKVLKNFAIAGKIDFGDAGQIWPWIPAKGDAESPTRFISKVTLGSANFSTMLNALNEQGHAKVLSNPKLTVLNGQPAVLSVFKNTTYIKKVTVTKGTTDSPGDTYAPEPGTVSAGIALGILPSIVNGNTVILHLTPITTDLINGKVAERTFADGTIIGLPQVSVREMSTTVEVHSGEMLIIGGLIDQVRNNTSDFAPLVGDIPVLKYLFGVKDKQMQRRELVILLTPRII
ncbi:MAG: hypothetical protein GWP11_08010, partial [Proteobacteria bacterium]|nr:hypothetical protein [Pseudomonadota bacterium]